MTCLGCVVEAVWFRNTYLRHLCSHTLRPGLGEMGWLYLEAAIVVEIGGIVCVVGLHWSERRFCSG